MARFRYFKDDGKEKRIYAFSGHNGKAYHNMPFEWCKTKYKKRFDNKNRDIVVVNAADQNLGQNMILTLFDVLKRDMHKHIIQIGQMYFRWQRPML